jgi:hypothetical protein
MNAMQNSFPVKRSCKFSVQASPALMALLCLILFSTLQAIKFKYYFTFEEAPDTFRKLRDPVALTAGPKGNIFVTDPGFNRVVKFSQKGKYLGEIGGPGTGVGQFDNPRGITRSKGFGIYISDAQNYRLVQIDDRLNFISSFSLNDKATDGIFCPSDAAAASDGLLYTCDEEDGDVLCLERDNRFYSLFKTDSELRGKTLKPGSIMVIKNSIFLSDAKSGRIYRFDKFGNFLNAFGEDLSVPLSGFTSMEDSLVVVAGASVNEIVAYSAKGKKVFSFSPYTPAGHFAPGAVCFSQGRLYVIHPEIKNIVVFEKY